MLEHERRRCTRLALDAVRRADQAELMRDRLVLHIVPRALLTALGVFELAALELRTSRPTAA